MSRIVSESVDRYFKALSVFGKKSYCEVDKLLVLIFIDDLLNSDCGFTITEQEYDIIHRALYCLFGTTCLIPYPEYLSNSTLSCQ